MLTLFKRKGFSSKIVFLILSLAPHHGWRDSSQNPDLIRPFSCSQFLPRLPLPLTPELREMPGGLPPPCLPSPRHMPLPSCFPEESLPADEDEGKSRPESSCTWPGSLWAFQLLEPIKVPFAQATLSWDSVACSLQKPEWHTGVAVRGFRRQRGVHWCLSWAWPLSRDVVTCTGQRVSSFLKITDGRKLPKLV